MRRIKVHIELEVPDNITENMVGFAYDNEECRVGEILGDELQDGEVKVTVFNVFKN